MLLSRLLISLRTTVAQQSPASKFFYFMPSRKNTKKAAVVKRKTATQKSYTVAELRALLQQAAGALIAIDHWLDTKIEQMTKEQR